MKGRGKRGSDAGACISAVPYKTDILADVSYKRKNGRYRKKYDALCRIPRNIAYGYSAFFRRCNVNVIIPGGKFTYKPEIFCMFNGRTIYSDLLTITISAYSILSASSTGAVLP